MSEITENNINGAYAIHMLAKIAANAELREVTLVAGIDGQKFLVHRLMMMSSSNYFQALLGPNFREGRQEEVTIRQITGPILREIIKFCYSGNIKITAENVIEIVEAASAMHLVGVELKCERFWSDSLALPNCVDIFLLADKYTFPVLRLESFDFICEYFDEVAREKLVGLDVSHFAEILISDKLHALEDMVFNRLLEWIEHEEDERHMHFQKLVELIQIEKISMLFLLEVVEKYATNYGGMDLLIGELRRRSLSDVRSPERYRNPTYASQNIFIATGARNIVTIQEYNMISNRWDISRTIKIAELTNRTAFGLLMDQSQIHLIGGHDERTSGHYFDSLVTYDMESLKKTGVKMMIERKGYITSIVLDNHVYILGGWNGTLLNTCERFSLATMTSEKIEPMKHGRHEYAVAVMDGKIYIAGGVGDDKDYSYLNTAECYDPIKNEWTEIAGMNHPRAEFALAELNGVLYAMGGHESIERYDPAEDMWTEIGSFKDSEYIVRTVKMHNEIYVIARNIIAPGFTFGKFKTDPECTLQRLRLTPNRSSFVPILFTN